MDFVRVCAFASVPENGVLAVRAEGTALALVRSGAELYAVGDRCSHADVSLSDGEAPYDGTIECWLHGSCFDLRTGRPTNLPATEPIATYPAEVRDGDVYVLLEPVGGG